jgi:hypothetical protein
MNLATNGLSFASYADAIRGATDGPVIMPGDPANSKLLAVQSAGGHPGQLNPDELTAIKNWIIAGAPDK